MLISLAVYVHHVVLGRETNAGEEVHKPARQVSKVMIKLHISESDEITYIPKCIIVYMTTCIYHYAFNEFSAFCV